MQYPAATLAPGPMPLVLSRKRYEQVTIGPLPDGSIVTVTVDLICGERVLLSVSGYDTLIAKP